MPIPRKVGKYLIHKELGRGGFGVVYHAHDPDVPRDVALKLQLATEPGLVERMRREAAACGNLHHENIVTIYAAGEHRGRPYIVMELLPGEDLRDLLASGRRPTLADGVSIMEQVARGLLEAHSAGIVHRDIKPGNIRILPGGEVKVMDFGIVRLTRENFTSYTSQAGLLGTVKYMAPEQLEGKPCDQRSDIFSYGLTFYETLTGLYPFPAADITQLMHQIKHVAPRPVRLVQPQCPDGLEALLERALAKEPAQRYASLADVLLDLAPIQDALKRLRARRLHEEATRLNQAGHPADACLLCLEALDLDPGNGAALSFYRGLAGAARGPLGSGNLRRRIAALLETQAYETVERLGEALMRVDSHDGIAAAARGAARRALGHAGVAGVQTAHTAEAVTELLTVADGEAATEVASTEVASTEVASTAESAAPPPTPPPPAAPAPVWLRRRNWLLGGAGVLALAGAVWVGFPRDGEPQQPPAEAAPTPTPATPPQPVPTESPKAQTKAPPSVAQEAAPTTAPTTARAQVPFGVEPRLLRVAIPAGAKDLIERQVRIRGPAAGFTFTVVPQQVWLSSAAAETTGPGRLTIYIDPAAVGSDSSGMLEIYSEQLGRARATLIVELTR